MVNDVDQRKELHDSMRRYNSIEASSGFGLIELMIALLITAFGLLAAGDFLFIAIRMNTLSRSKTTATLAAKETLEYLSALCQQNPTATELQPGIHGPRQSSFNNPLVGSLLNSYNVTWDVEEVNDLRQDIVLKAKTVRVQVQPVQEGGSGNIHPLLNKSLSMTTTLACRIR
jgi:hypothetical protein